MKFYIWMRKQRVTINAVLTTVFASLLFNVISDNHGNLFSDFREIFINLIDPRSLSGVLIISSLLILAIFNLAFEVASHQLSKRIFSKGFPDLMKEFTSLRIQDSVGKGCISWGEAKTVEICNDIVRGWDPANILIDSYNDKPYRFFDKKEIKAKYGNKSYYFKEEDWLVFKEAYNLKAVMQKGDNLTRFMLTDCSKNYDKRNRKLLLSLGTTQWSQVCYVWNKFRDSNGSKTGTDLMRAYSKGISSGCESEIYLPNNFCLHLLVETLDNRVVLSNVSNEGNDNHSCTESATLEEQLESGDFIEGSNYLEDFVLNWSKRAFLKWMERTSGVECGSCGKCFDEAVGSETLKVISVNFEADRYNFSLFCTVQLPHTLEDFQRKICKCKKPDNPKGVEIDNVKIENIPAYLMTYKNENERNRNHPSTYLELLLFLMHKYGYSKSEHMLVDDAKNLVDKGALSALRRSTLKTPSAQTASAAGER